LQDHLFSFAGILPWRCASCGIRFHARAMPFRSFLYAHCRICGNHELQRISAEYVPGVTAVLGRIFRLPALRCEPCRNKFFSVRPLRQEEPQGAAAQSQQ
jgi:hypothetical protein